MENNKNINWFPGHMVKTINEIKSSMKLIDIVVMVVDSRAPFASENSFIFDIIINKPVIIVFNKYDLADKKVLDKNINEYIKRGYQIVKTNGKLGEGIKELKNAIIKVGEKVKYSNKTNESFKNVKKIFRVLITGSPNVGKSTIINRLLNKNTEEVRNKPGVTVRNKWIKVDDNIELLDTPGLLAKKLDKDDVGIKLALIGNIKEEIVDIEELAIYFLNYIKLNNLYLNMLKEKYNLEDTLDSVDMLEKIGRYKGAIAKGGEVDFFKTSKLLLDDFRNGKIGKISLE